MRISAFVTVSLDNFIARKNGDIDWIEEANKNITENNDCGYFKYTNSVDTFILGRNTYEKIISLGSWHYSKPVIVLTSDLESLYVPETLKKQIATSNLNPITLINRLKNIDTLNHISIEGGFTIQNFIANHLLDDIIITKVPILIGEGKPLFGPISYDKQIMRVNSHAYKFGFNQDHYRFINLRNVI